LKVTSLKPTSHDTTILDDLLAHVPSNAKVTTIWQLKETCHNKFLNQTGCQQQEQYCQSSLLNQQTAQVTHTHLLWPNLCLYQPSSS